MQKSLQTHIAEHLLRLFLLALPDRNDLPEDGPDSGNDHSSASRSTVHIIDMISQPDDDAPDAAPQEVPVPAADPAVIDRQWAALWASPQLQNSIRVIYTGAEHDELLLAKPEAYDSFSLSALEVNLEPPSREDVQGLLGEYGL